MTEEEPLERAGDMKPTKVPLKGPNVISTVNMPPPVDAVRTQAAAIRKHLQDRRSAERPPEA